MSDLDHLPAVYAPSPECGHCYTVLESDGDGYQCDRCGLYWPYDSMDSPAQFLDDDAPACGVTGRDRVEVDRGAFSEGRCVLPESHRSEHLHVITLVEEGS